MSERQLHSGPERLDAIGPKTRDYAHDPTRAKMSKANLRRVFAGGGAFNSFAAVGHRRTTRGGLFDEQILRWLGLIV
jgi:hypothetical protein